MVAVIMLGKVIKMNREDYFKYYIQGSDHYLIPKDVFMELFNEMINWKEESKILRENAEHNDKVVDKVNWENQLLKKENKQLKGNWNKLKEYCKENTLCYEVGDDENTKLIGSRIHGLNVLNKMQELEKSDK